MSAKYQVPGNMSVTLPWGTKGAESMAFSLRLSVSTNFSGLSFCLASSLYPTSEMMLENLARAESGPQSSAILTE